MPRLARVVIPGYPHHIIQRGNRRQVVFFNDGDRFEYLNLISEYTRANGIEIWAYCLMDNHVHLITVPQESESLAGAIGEVHRRYTRHINFREGWRGYLWQGRFMSYPMDDRHLFSAVRYVEKNPVRAGLVKRAEDYRWSSASAHVYHLKNDIISFNERLIRMIGDWAEYLNVPDQADEIRLFKQHARTGRPLGDRSFIQKLEDLTGRVLEKQKPGRKLRK